MGRKKIYFDAVEKKAMVARSAKKYQANNLDKVRAQHIKRTYGLEWQHYLTMFANQNGSCAICKTPLSLYPKQNNLEVAHVDHCHETGKVRGLLCRACNSGLGYLKESALMCKLAAEYLEKI